MVAEEIELNAHLEAMASHRSRPISASTSSSCARSGRATSLRPRSTCTGQMSNRTSAKRTAHLDANRPLDSRPQLVAEARTVMRQHFEAADAGITGANFLVAETGTAVIVTNEGNGDLTRLLPKTHIVVTGIEKVVPSLGDVSILLRLLTRSATGQDITSYVSLMSGPKRASDADGPEAFHVVLVDNGRSALLNSPAREILQCIRCGACLNHCPVYGVIGGHAYGAVYPGPLGAALDPGLDGIAKTYDLPNASSFCGRCDSVCPVKIPLTRIMRYWRNEAFAHGLPSGWFNFGLSWWGAFARRPRLYRMVAGIAAGVLRLAAGKGARLSSFPMLRGWFAARDLPKPARTSFQSQWRKTRR